MKYGPWIPIEPLRAWIEKQIEDHDIAPRTLATDLGISERRLWDWRKSKRQRFVRMHLVEDALWHFDYLTFATVFGDVEIYESIQRAPRTNNKGSAQ